jgi:uroporphyrinogen-III synthase
VPIYQYALPEDLEPLRRAIQATVDDGIDVILLTTATQVVHLFQVAAQMGLSERVRQGLAKLVVASVGPTTSEALRDYGIRVDVEASHPKMGVLVREAAALAPALLVRRRGGPAGVKGDDDADAG